ncbi:hypothetical protein GOP47_0012014 [Adiantum capillus-veneris]|uniref:Uncharacterized protein n=1 Tax=Adiantum capillus-veneris TaxID=13818 RepID=A0A9D4UTX8_ADICA|nr:hypothetical protein GOP47_0012014 [Adiantum capillus-veneris]
MIVQNTHTHTHTHTHTEWRSSKIFAQYIINVGSRVPHLTFEILNFQITLIRRPQIILRPIQFLADKASFQLIIEPPIHASTLGSKQDCTLNALHIFLMYMQLINL